MEGCDVWKREKLRMERSREVGEMAGKVDEERECRRRRHGRLSGRATWVRSGSSSQSRRMTAGEKGSSPEMMVVLSRKEGIWNLSLLWTSLFSMNNGEVWEQHKIQDNEAS